MVKQWKQSLKQTDIVSDGEAFPGSHIDQPISETGGGIDWPSKTTTLVTSDSPFSDTTGIDFSGAGYITDGYIGSAEAATSASIGIKFDVDGVEIYNDRIDGQRGFPSDDSNRNDSNSSSLVRISHPIRFESGFTVQETDGFDPASAYIWCELD